MNEIVYRNFIITYWCKPTPDRRFDYEYTHADYDGDGDNRCGFAGSLDECESEIDDYWDDFNSDQKAYK